MLYATDASPRFSIFQAVATCCILIGAVLLMGLYEHSPRIENLTAIEAHMVSAEDESSALTLIHHTAEDRWELRLQYRDFVPGTRVQVRFVNIPRGPLAARQDKYAPMRVIRDVGLFADMGATVPRMPAGEYRAFVEEHDGVNWKRLDGAPLAVTVHAMRVMADRAGHDAVLLAPGGWLNIASQDHSQCHVVLTDKMGANVGVNQRSATGDAGGCGAVMLANHLPTGYYTAHFTAADGAVLDEVSFDWLNRF